MKQQKEGGKTYCHDWRRWWHGGRQRRAGFGIFLIIIGGLWLGEKLGLFDPSLFWPLVFITIGTWLILSSFLRGKSDNLVE